MAHGSLHRQRSSSRTARSYPLKLTPRLSNAPAPMVTPFMVTWRVVSHVPLGFRIKASQGIGCCPDIGGAMARKALAKAALATNDLKTIVGVLLVFAQD